MSKEIFEVLDPGFGATLQDQGRRGWSRFGVPPGGAMDDHAAFWANRLLDNPPSAPVLELLLQGAQFRALQSAWICITGADAGSEFPLWRVLRIHKGDLVRFPENYSGLWTYLAVEGGFESELIFGSVSVYSRGGIGRPLAKDDRVSLTDETTFRLHPRVAGRFVHQSELRDYKAPTKLRVWPGPQWASFRSESIEAFFSSLWRISSQCDRVGYRLEGAPLHAHPTGIVSEPVRVGSIQVPEHGQPIVVMRDGPTVGGYPKLGMIHPPDLSRLAQCRAGQTVEFEAMRPATPMESTPR